MRLGRPAPVIEARGGEASGMSARAVDLIDRYLLGEPVSKPDVVASLLRERTTEPAAAPFYRAFEAVGARAADEAFIALRLVLAGRAPEDDAVARLRAFARIARACATGDTTGLRALEGKERAHVPDLPWSAGPAALGAAAKAGFREALGAL